MDYTGMAVISLSQEKVADCESSQNDRLSCWLFACFTASDSV